MAAQPPFTENLIYTSALYNSTTAAPLTLQNGFATQGTNTITNTFAINPNYRLPYAQNWTLAIAQTLPHNILMEFEYIRDQRHGTWALRWPPDCGGRFGRRRDSQCQRVRILHLRREFHL